MLFLNYEEQAIIKMYNFSSKEELKGKLKTALTCIEEEETKIIVENLISKIDNYTMEELTNIENIFE